MNSKTNPLFRCEFSKENIPNKSLGFCTMSFLGGVQLVSISKIVDEMIRYEAMKISDRQSPPERNRV